MVESEDGARLSAGWKIDLTAIRYMCSSQERVVDFVHTSFRVILSAEQRVHIPNRRETSRRSGIAERFPPSSGHTKQQIVVPNPSL